MSDIGIRASQRALDLFGGGRFSAAVMSVTAALELEPHALLPAQISGLNISPELAEKTTAVRYPQIHLYCERVVNEQREKFRRFSGRVRLVAEGRVTESRLELIQMKSQALADAITEVLDGIRGDWGRGMFYGGGFEINYGAVKAGGKNFVQATKVGFEVMVSAD
jgi:hypothetical protein